MKKTVPSIRGPNIVERLFNGKHTHQTLNNRTWYLRLHSKQPFLFNTLSKYSYNTSTTVDGNKFKAGGRRTHPTRCSLERAQQYGKCGEHKPCELEDRIRNLQRISYVSTSGTHPPTHTLHLKTVRNLGCSCHFGLVYYFCLPWFLFFE